MNCGLHESRYVGAGNNRVVGGLLLHLTRGTGSLPCTTRFNEFSLACAQAQIYASFDNTSIAKKLGAPPAPHAAP